MDRGGWRATVQELDMTERLTLSLFQGAAFRGSRLLVGHSISISVHTNNCLTFVQDSVVDVEYVHIHSLSKRNNNHPLE